MAPNNNNYLPWLLNLNFDEQLICNDSKIDLIQTEVVKFQCYPMLKVTSKSVPLLLNFEMGEVVVEN